MKLKTIEYIHQMMIGQVWDLAKEHQELVDNYRRLKAAKDFDEGELKGCIIELKINRDERKNLIDALKNFEEHDW